jgi:predicted  nucleic acid-binding Zn-ribbon protein
VTIQAQIEVLESLAAIDAELKVLSDALSQEREALDGKRTHLAELDARLARGEKSIEEMERTRNDLHAELRQMGSQIEKSREKLTRCRSEREANAVQRELEELRKLYRDREIEIEKLDVLIDEARAEVQQVSAERGTLAGELGAIEGDVTSRLGDAEKELAQKTAQRNSLIGKIQPGLYRRYELVRKRKGTALAWTHDGTCSACHMRLQPMLFQKLTRGDEFGQCPSCNRILYFRRDVPEGADSADAAGTQSSGP